MIPVFPAVTGGAAARVRRCLEFVSADRLSFALRLRVGQTWWQA
jgi:hypothetical protein